MPTPHGFIEKLAELSKGGGPFVSVTMVEAVGSTPQDAGSKMLVDAGGGWYLAQSVAVAWKTRRSNSRSRCLLRTVRRHATSLNGIYSEMSE